MLFVYKLASLLYISIENMSNWYIYCMYSAMKKSMAFYHDFGYSFPHFSSLLKKGGRRRGEWIAKTWSKVMTFCSIIWNMSQNYDYKICLPYDLN